MTALVPIPHSDSKSSLVALYEGARYALDQAIHVDDVVDVLGKITAIKEYARMALDRSLEINAAELTIRAKRRLGEEIVNLKAEGLLRKPMASAAERAQYVQDYYKHKKKNLPKRTKKKLADIGISLHMASESQAYATIPAPQFETNLKSWRERLVSAPTSQVTKRLSFSDRPRQNLPQLQARARRMTSDFCFLAPAGHRALLPGHSYPALVAAGRHARELAQRTIRDAILVDRLMPFAPKMTKGELLGDVISDDQVRELCRSADVAAKQAMEQIGLVPNDPDSLQKWRRTKKRARKQAAE